MALISNERTFTWQNLQSVTSFDIMKVLLFCAVALPFFIYKRAAPQFAFFAELTSVIFIALFIICASLAIKRSEHFIIPNRLSVFLAIFASYLAIDMYINQPVYPSIQWLYIGSIILGALLASVTVSLCYAHSYQKIFRLLCYCLMIGAVLQDLVVLLQMQHQEWLYGWIYTIEVGGSYSGNIGQRNLLAHYLSWGVLATGYLVYSKSINNLAGWGLIIFQTAIMGNISSRAILVYTLAILVFVIITTIWQKQLPSRLFKIIAGITLLILAFQVLTSPLLAMIQPTSQLEDNSIARMATGSGILSRMSEWHKAWLIFLEHPWFGSGWGSYGYEGFIMSSSPEFTHTPYENRLFSHSHSLIFNLLAENGIIGTLIILVGFGYVIKPLFTKDWQVETVFLLSMLIVTGVHSLVELPLWHVHFFIVFVLLVTILISTLTASYQQSHYSQSSILKPVVIAIGITYALLAVQLYYYYWQMEQYTYASDKNEQERLTTAQNILAVGQKQPLLSAYSDYLASSYLIGLSPDKIPTSFHQPLNNFSHYLPQKNLGIYYLATQCDTEGKWSDNQWQYYSQLKHYYNNVISSTSIVLDMTDRCDAVFKKIYTDCKSIKLESNQKPICSYPYVNE